MLGTNPIHFSSLSSLFKKKNVKYTIHTEECIQFICLVETIHICFMYFCGADSKYFWPCRTCSFCQNYSSLLFVALKQLHNVHNE